jgi:hypothetical protein
MKRRIADVEIADLVAALAVAKAFVRALAIRDEPAARALCYGPSLSNWDLSHGVVGLWRQGKMAPFFHRFGHSMTARLIDGSDQPLVCFGFLVTTEADEDRGPRLIEGPRPATVIALFETASGWRVWGQPDSIEFHEGTVIDIPLDTVGLDGGPPSPPV